MVSNQTDKDIIPINSLYSSIFRMFNKAAGIQDLRLIDYEEFFQNMQLKITDANKKPLNADVYFNVKQYGSDEDAQNIIMTPNQVGHYNITKVA